MPNQSQLQQSKVYRLTLGIPQNIASFTPILTPLVPPLLE